MTKYFHLGVKSNTLSEYIFYDKGDDFKLNKAKFVFTSPEQEKIKEVDTLEIAIFDSLYSILELAIEKSSNRIHNFSFSPDLLVHGNDISKIEPTFVYDKELDNLVIYLDGVLKESEMKSRSQKIHSFEVKNTTISFKFYLNQEDKIDIIELPNASTIINY